MLRQERGGMIHSAQRATERDESKLDARISRVPYTHAHATAPNVVAQGYQLHVLSITQLLDSD